MFTIGVDWGMGDAKLLSRCGIYCGACYVYRAERDGGEFLRRVTEWQKVRPDEVHCLGCGGPEGEMWVNCRLCPVRGCLGEKGFGTCAECGEFADGSCERYEGLAAFCSRRGEDVRASVAWLSRDPEGWLAGMGERWRCASCGRMFSWYDEVCHNCGADLERTDLRP